MTPEQICAHIEGLLSYQLSTTFSGATVGRGRSTVSSWYKAVKAVLLAPWGEPDFRYLTDLEFTRLVDVDESGEAITDATHLIAALVEMTSTIATDGDAWVTFADLDSQTLDGTAALNNATVAAISISDVVTTGVAEYYPAIWLAGQSDDGTYATTGIALATGLTVACDGVDGGNPAANAVNVWVLYRT